jgi:aspartokinase
MNIAGLTREYISQHHHLKECLRLGLINYSALAREVCSYAGTDRFDAVLVACRRLASRIKGQDSEGKRIRQLLKQSRIELKNRIVVVVIEKPRDYERLYQVQKSIKKERGDFHIIEGAHAIVIISEQKFLPLIRETFRSVILKTTQGLAQISMAFDEKIESTPGVVAQIYGLLADNGINVLEEMSSWIELMIVVDEKEAVRAMQVLSF